MDDNDDIGGPENIPPLNLCYCNAMKIKTSNFNFANLAIHRQLHMTTGTKYKASMFFYGTQVRSLSSLVSNWQTHGLTDCFLVDLIDVTLGGEDFYVIADVEAGVGESLLQLSAWQQLDNISLSWKLMWNCQRVLTALLCKPICE